MKCNQLIRRLSRPAVFATLAAAVAIGFQSCEDDLLEGQPSWLGNSIYERLQEEGNYQTTLRMIDDLGLHDVMSETGSKTIFAANDEAYQEWFRTNTWGVRSYEQLSTPQKNMLMNTQLLNNAYLVELLGNAKAKGEARPEAGMVLRRETAASIYDSIYTVLPEDMPNSSSWNNYRERVGGIHMVKDQSTAPVMMFMPAYMKYNKITNEDLSLITNGQATSIEDAFVNGQRITERDITCKNGYIHKVAGVVAPLENMAQVIHNTPTTSKWAALLDRFSAPFKVKQETTKEYNRLYNTQDSLYTYNYYNDQNRRTSNMDDAIFVTTRLLFDPGENQYMYSNTMQRDFTYDAGAMIVPTDEAYNQWLATGGRALLDEYVYEDSIPDLVISKLIKVNMIENFSDKVPSKFDNVTNDAKNKLGIVPEDIVECKIGCNGVIYIVKRLLGPAEYSSVTFPALVREKSRYAILYKSIDDYEYSPYLHSMDTEYSLLMPADEAMMWYVDPINSGENTQTLLQFRFDKQTNKLMTARYECNVDSRTGQITVGNQITAETAFKSTQQDNRLKNMMEDLIVVGDINDGHEYYKTKGGAMLRVKKDGANLKVQGGWQIENNCDIEAKNVFAKSKAEGGNGWSYDLATMMPLPASKSVYQLLSEKPEYSKFLELMNSSADSAQYTMFSKTMEKDKYKCANATANFNIRVFDNYNYTVYVPTNAAIQELEDKGYLPTWADYEHYNEIAQNGSSAEEVEDAKAKCIIIKNRIINFLRYHIQDNSIAIGMAPQARDDDGNLIYDGKYESMMINPVNKRFYPLNVNFDASQMTVKDVIGTTAKVVTTAGLYNNICKEYWFSGNGNSRDIYQTSDAVVHQIDHALIYDASQLTPWDPAKQAKPRRTKKHISRK